jgi:hypothetical protein
LVQTIGTGQGAISTPYYTIGNWGLLGNYWNGDIANLQIYNGSLNSNQISTLYKEGITGLPLNDGSLAAWYPLNGNARDYSGSGNDGLAYNVTFPYFYLAGYTPGSNQVLSELTSIFNIANIFQLFGLTTPTPLGNGQYHVVVTLTNTQSLPTPVPFQQMVTVDSATYSNYEDTNLDNVYFSYANGTIIPSWLESCSSTCSTSGSSSTSTVYWLKLNKPIPADGEMLIYMSFAPKGVNMFNGKTIGEAPQLSTTYAQYDDGANVFGFYDNFAGTMINSEWTQVIPSGTTISQNNGITISTDSSATYGGLILTNGYTGIQIFEGYITAVSGVAAGLALQTGNLAGSGGIDFNYWSGSVATGSMSGGMTNSNNPNLQVSTGIDGGAWISSSSQVWYKNYVATSGSQTAYALPSIIYPSIGIYYSSSSTSITYQWVRTRAYPPNGVMPSVNFGLVGS